MYSVEQTDTIINKMSIDLGLSFSEFRTKNSWHLNSYPFILAHRNINKHISSILPTKNVILEINLTNKLETELNAKFNEIQ